MTTASDTTQEEIVSAALIVIGDEILSGRTKDKNIAYIADHLARIGIRLSEVRIVPDDEDRIVAAVNALRSAYTYIFTTGGIGPTHDDITADSLAKAFAVPIDIDERAVAIMKPHYESRGLDLNDARLRMARIPKGADLVNNPVSHTPGFMLENVIVMAGIPGIMQVMLDAVTPRLKKGRPMLSVTIVVERPESDVSSALRQTQESYPDVPMGSYPYVKDGRFGTQLVLRSTDEGVLADAAEALRARLHAEGLI